MTFLNTRITVLFILGLALAVPVFAQTTAAPGAIVNARLRTRKTGCRKAGGRSTGTRRDN
jgi:hypothetical protein